ncbi:MAG: hypothetical protein HETSPECPRED_006725 [Heterodermia speciosa]|uniref:Uncharacterized protein n=1 Tax=Heterodermia speciosa TaxID=116794 RepID=A0A8H3IV68_9LECA|nr:MAG: hypothetical protein HETSPECPRED_006725 [Heterodermia speciosa]
MEELLSASSRRCSSGVNNSSNNGPPIPPITCRRQNPTAIALTSIIDPFGKSSVSHPIAVVVSFSTQVSHLILT